MQHPSNQMYSKCTEIIQVIDCGEGGGGYGHLTKLTDDK